MAEKLLRRILAWPTCPTGAQSRFTCWVPEATQEGEPKKARARLYHLWAVWPWVNHFKLWVSGSSSAMGTGKPSATVHVNSALCRCAVHILHSHKWKPWESLPCRGAVSILWGRVLKTTTPDPDNWDRVNQLRSIHPVDYRVVIKTHDGDLCLLRQKAPRALL